MEMATKNIRVGDSIKDLMDLKRLADEKKSVAFRRGIQQIWAVRPAAFMMQWPLAQLMNLKLYYTIKK